MDDVLASEDWELYEHFTTIEENLFLALVSKTTGISSVTYGYIQPEILVKPRPETRYGIPIMLNREIDSGYWDHPINLATSDCLFTFVSFFDWDQKSYKDNRYVRVVVKDWPENLSLVGKHALIETQYVLYNKA
jgi:hypothetical protein